MPEIQPFRGVLYRVPPAELARVLAPPYDVIPEAYRDELYGRDSRNVVRAILNREPGQAGYAEAGATYRRWVAEGVLVEDSADALYLLEQAFEAEGRTLRRHGLIARFRAEDAERGSILPHEQTRAAAKEDRWRVLQATRANFSPIFLIFPDPERLFADEASHAMSVAPALAYSDDGGVAHRLWRLTDAEAIGRLTAILASRKAYIADGHHRYATALRQRDAAGPEGAWTLGYFTPIESPGLVVLPYHRVLALGPAPREAFSALDGPFAIADAWGVTEAARLVSASSAPHAFALAWPGGQALVAESRPEGEALLPAGAAPSLRALDSYFVHQAVLPRLGVLPEAVDYVHSPREAEQAVARGRLALLLRGTPVRQIVAVAEARESMPAKSTFFHPKLPSGLVIHPLVA